MIDGANDIVSANIESNTMVAPAVSDSVLSHAGGVTSSNPFHPALLVRGRQRRQQV